MQTQGGAVDQTSSEQPARASRARFERIVNLAGTSSFTSQTSDTNNAPGSDEPGKPNVYHISPNIGGLLVADEEHTITKLNSQIGPVTIIIDSVSTMSSTSPVKLT